MDNLAFISRYEAILREKQLSKRALYEACGITDAAVSQWRKGKTAPSMKSISRIADFLGVTSEYLLTGVETEKAPALTDKDRRDIARDLELIMSALDSAGDLQFDGDPMSDEARESIRAAMKLGLEAARVKNKERFTPRKYRKG